MCSLKSFLCILLTIAVVAGGCEQSSQMVDPGPTPVWRWQHPLPQGNTLNGAWGYSEFDVFFVGERGTITRFKSPGIDLESSPTSEDLHHAFGFGTGTVWAVGDNGTIIARTSSWESVASPTTDHLRWMWGPSATDIFAVGDNGTIIHYDGTDWSNMTSPTAANLHAVFGTDSDNVFAVGANGTYLHWGGVAWAAEPSFTAENLNSIWTNNGHWFACGDNGALFVDDGEGAGWQVKASPTGGNLYSVFGSDTADVFCLGEVDSMLYYTNDQTWYKLRPSLAPVLREGWMRLPIGPSPRQRNAAHGGFVFNVGDGGVVHYYNLLEWQVISGHQTFADLTAIDGSGAMRLAVGSNGAVFRRTGGAWDEEASGTGETLYDVSVVDANTAFAVGENGVILRYDGGNWQNISTISGVALRGVHATSSNSALIVGDNGTLLSYDGNDFTQFVGVPSITLHDVWQTSDGTQFIVVGEGYFATYNGVYMFSNVPENFYAVDGHNNEAIIVGEAGASYPWSSGSFQGRADLPTVSDLVDVSMADGIVVAVAHDGGVWVRHGGAWQFETTPIIRPLSAVYSASASSVTTVGTIGAVLQRSP